MFTIDELLSKHNQNAALEHFSIKKDGSGPDGMKLSEFPEYWRINHERIEKEIRECTYQAGIIRDFEILNSSGKKRNISNLNVTDRFITRLLAQKLKRYIEPEFLECSYAYQDGKGTLDAVMKAKAYVEEGFLFVAEIDIKNFFDTISLVTMTELIKQKITDQAVLALINQYLYCKISTDDRIVNKAEGLVQGNSISPILSNMYLHSLDLYMEEKSYRWLRFADNIYIFEKSQENAISCYEDICDKIKTKYHLELNQKKSGVHDVLVKPILGYDIYRSKGKVDVRRHRYQPVNTYNNWHSSVVQKINQEYHILQDGILNKKDYALLFENDKERHHIPVEVVDQLNIYGEVSISYSALKTLWYRNIKVSVFNKYGDLMGNYIPERHTGNAVVGLRQAQLYNDADRHLQIAKQMEIAGIHNMRANLKYYNKKKKDSFNEYIAALSKYIVEINEGILRIY